jgi:hypothetical protein
MHIAINLCFIFDTFCQHFMLGLWVFMMKSKAMKTNSACVPTGSERHSKALDNTFHCPVQYT